MTTEERQLAARLYDYATTILRGVKEALDTDEFNTCTQVFVSSVGMNYDPHTSEKAVEHMIQRSNERIKELTK